MNDNNCYRRGRERVIVSESFTLPKVLNVWERALKLCTELSWLPCCFGVGTWLHIRGVELKASVSALAETCSCSFVFHLYFPTISLQNTPVNCTILLRASRQDPTYAWSVSILHTRSDAQDTLKSFTVEMLIEMELVTDAEVFHRKSICGQMELKGG
jgi:hypothetical protein